MTLERRRLYEGMYVISATLSDDARQKALEKIKASSTTSDGEIVKVHEMGKRKLAYEIRDQREGVYFLVYFNLASDKIKGLWRDHHLNEDLLRFNTLQAEEVLEELDFPQLALAQERR